MVVASIVFIAAIPREAVDILLSRRVLPISRAICWTPVVHSLALSIQAVRLLPGLFFLFSSIFFPQPKFLNRIVTTNRFAKNRCYVESLCVMVLQGLHRGWVNMKSKLGEVKQALTLWTKSLKTIEGKHPRTLVSCYMVTPISFHTYVSQTVVVWFTLCTHNKRVLY